MTTTTISTTGACYTTAAAITTSCSKKKRSIIDTGPIQASLKNPKIIPALTFVEEYEQPKIIGYSVQYPNKTRTEKSFDLSKLQELNQVADVQMGREEIVQPRFIDQYLYWFTTTTTSTLTSYTKTTTFTIDGCTPAGNDFVYSACG